MSTVRLVVIDGTNRKEGETRKLAALTAKYAAKAGAVAEFFNHSETPLPLFDGEESKLELPALQRLFTLISEADVIVFSSPEYHNSMSSTLKNILDWLSLLDNRMQGKLVGLIGGGASLGNSGALVQMMMAVRSMHAWLMPEAFVSVQNIWDAFDEQGELNDVELRQRMEAFIEKLLRYAPRFRAPEKIAA